MKLVDVTHMVEDSDSMFNLSGSVMEHGDNAGRITWDNSKAYAAEHPLLKTAEDFVEARDHFRGYGAWSAEEIEDWTVEELQAITVQDVAGAIREMEAYDTIEEFEAAAEKGNVSGRLGRGDNGRWYFHLGI